MNNPTSLPHPTVCRACFRKLNEPYLAYIEHLESKLTENEVITARRWFHGLSMRRGWRPVPLGFRALLDGLKSLLPLS